MIRLLRKILLAPVSLTGFLVVCGLLGSLATVLGYFGSWNWMLELFSHFRVQYAVTLPVIALGLWLRRRPVFAFCFGVFSIANWVQIIPFIVPRSIVVPADARTCRAILLNVNTEQGSPSRIADLFKTYNPDFILLEEMNTKWVEALEPSLRLYPHRLLEPRDDNFGIALYSRIPLRKGEIVSIGEADVPSVFAEIETPSGSFALVGTHPLPPGGAEYSRLRNEQLQRLPELLRRTSLPIVLMGDLNVTPWSPYFSRLLRDASLVNSAVGRGIQPTWPAMVAPFWIPIDHCLYSEGVMVKHRSVGPNVGSDHYPLIVDFTIAGQGSGSPAHIR